MSLSDLVSLSTRLSAALHLATPPIAISFRDDEPAEQPYGAMPPAPTPTGRTGAVPAGCVFWIKAAERTFATSASDHANCTVGSLTHGLVSAEEAAKRDDVAAVLEAQWVTPADVARLPRVAEKPAAIVYGPLAEARAMPDVVLVRIDALALMTLHGALADLAIEGRPQCHIVAMAKESNAVAASVGCALSRARTGMKATEMTCAIPGKRLAEVVAQLEATAKLDRDMARYASEDAKRFG